MPRPQWPRHPSSDRAGRGSLEAEDHLDLDGAVEGKDGDADCGARVAPRVAEDLAEHFARAVDDARLPGELGDGCHEPDDLDDAAEPVDTAHGGCGGGDGVERRLAGVPLGVGGRDEPVAVTDLSD